MGNEEISLRWLSGISSAASGQIMIRTSRFPENWKYEIISGTGQIILQGKMELHGGTDYYQRESRNGFKRYLYIQGI